MSFDEKVKSLADQWVEHCNKTMLHSNIDDYLKHPAFHALVDLGRQAIPYIIHRYQNDDFTPWGFVLEEITGVGIITDRKCFNPSEVKKRWLEWWHAQNGSSEYHVQPVTSEKQTGT